MHPHEGRVVVGARVIVRPQRGVPPGADRIVGSSDATFASRSKRGVAMPEVDGHRGASLVQYPVSENKRGPAVPVHKRVDGQEARHQRGRLDRRVFGKRRGTSQQLRHGGGDLGAIHEGVVAGEYRAVPDHPCNTGLFGTHQLSMNRENPSERPSLPGGGRGGGPRRVHGPGRLVSADHARPVHRGNSVVARWSFTKKSWGLHNN